MNTLSLSIPISAFELKVLLKGTAITALPKMYVKGKSFLLYPLENHDSSSFYHSVFHGEAPINTQTNTNTVIIESWAKCEICERVQRVDEMNRLAQSTIWTDQGLAKHRGQFPHLFLAYLRVYRLPKPIAVDRISTAQDKVGKFMGLNQAVVIDDSQPVLTEEQFDNAAQRLKDRQPIIIIKSLELSESNSVESAAIAPPLPPIPQPPKPQPIQTQIPEEPPQPPVPKSILEPTPKPAPSYDLTQIADVGNSSEGHAFERLVRQGLLFLGFQNSETNPKASLDPGATGGAGGLDFYADYPYPIVGECKATKTEKVPDGTPAQLVKLGHKILKDHYHDCIKLVIAAGELTSAANETASGNQINVLRPETIQRLVNLKQHYSGAINLFKLKDILESEPFSEAVNARINTYVDGMIDEIQTRINLIDLVQQHHPASVELLKGIYLGRYGKTLDPLDLHYILVELASPFTGFLGRKRGQRWQEDQFYFVREFDHLPPTSF
ncbi:DUF1802 family protein [Spirulina major]|uniref:DUF1802 family protein n=1 Tax=Spirulina major TaxID=270636 RepID=UPI000934AE7A|nr:DUF1802 family protein [Spirulina major]